MPISSMNELPHLHFEIGNDNDTASICALYDTSGALNTGQLAYHRYIMEYIPEAVYDFETMEKLSAANSRKCVKCSTYAFILW